ncbi:Type II secretory pathway, pullulanase PulA [Gemmobacter sp.]|uniref:Type II secretory pathway, pullulanase PulA n=1 Tax=Gemmobacter sp. TaxID=1898957 RepID=UPI002B0005F5|nr:Type II secretory pathway, pullulanase PulA [Gemmobacter sp.]
MILSQGRRYLFVHAPKTGGTALMLALEARAMKDDLIVGDTPKARARRRRLAGLTPRGRLWKHSTLADLDGILPDGGQGLFVLTLVRNPWDRMVSYYHWLRGQRFAHPAVALAQRVEFAAFLRDPATQGSMANWPYAAWVRQPDGQERCDLFVRLEHLDSDLAPFEAHLGLRLAPVARANASNRARDWRVFYDDDTAGIVARLCAPDIARFGYRFDP